MLKALITQSTGAGGVGDGVGDGVGACVGADVGLDVGDALGVASGAGYHSESRILKMVVVLNMLM